MTNQDVIEMVHLGLSDDVVIDKIHATEITTFDTSISGLRVLKSAKVSDAVIRIMINPRADNPGAAGPVIPTTAQHEEAGVYAVLNGKQAEMEPEVVNWQTGGVAKNIVTVGIVKGDRNGKIMKPRSPTQTRTPLEFFIKTLDGTSATEYQLLRLHQKGNRREFRSVTGGVLHQSGGAQRDEVPFEPEKVGDRLWRVRLNSLLAGEYGFLAPGVSSMSISASGKMYTFGVIREDVEVARAPIHDDRRNDSARSTSGGTPPIQGFDDAAIGASSAGNPTVRHDGITLASVMLGGPADRAGIKAGDVVLAIDDRYLFTADELTAEIRRHKPGTRVSVRYRRYSSIDDCYLVVGSAQQLPNPALR